MTHPNHDYDHHNGSYSHAAGIRLEAEVQAILERGLAELLEMTEGLEFRPLNSEKYPLPLAHVAYRTVPDVQTLREEIKARMHADPVSVLENALALLELYECNQPDIAEHIPDDVAFIKTCFASKRCNGWVAVIGNTDRDAIEAAINERWQFRFFNGPRRETNVYVLLNMLARYGFVYGQIRFGDAHLLSHFVEDHTPGLIVCRGKMTNLEMMLSLAAMKMGVPAIVQDDYPFPLGRTIRAERLEQISDAVVSFQNIRRLLKMPGIPQMPDYCDPEHQKEKVPQDVIWGDTQDSFYIVRKGKVTETGTTVIGRPDRAIGVVVTIDAEPLDAFDRAYIERRSIGALSMMRGVGLTYTGDKFLIYQAQDTNLDPNRIGEVLIAAIRREWPKLNRIRAEVVFDVERLTRMAPSVRQEKQTRDSEIKNASEETADRFYTCLGCSPFAPDHVCILTPQRPPQCNRPFEQIKTGSLYAYDDMSNIHHSKLHRDISSFGVIEKGRCLDPSSGEWEGINEAAARLSHARTRRILLHSLDENPHTGCACFRLIMFKTDKPRPGIGIMEAGYEGRAPDGRCWKDLHYALSGKQTPGMAGASPRYLFSSKFLRAHGGWKSVVWVSPKIADIMGDSLPPGIVVGDGQAADGPGQTDQ